MCIFLVHRKLSTLLQGHTCNLCNDLIQEKINAASLSPTSIWSLNENPTLSLTSGVTLDKFFLWASFPTP